MEAMNKKKKKTRIDWKTPTDGLPERFEKITWIRKSDGRLFENYLVTNPEATEGVALWTRENTEKIRAMVGDRLFYLELMPEGFKKEGKNYDVF